MEISPAQLVDEVRSFLATYPWVWQVETTFHLPRGLLLAVGSRETNLTNEVGDGGHGHGVWQLDDRYHVIPAGFDTQVATQAATAAQMLEYLLDLCAGNVDQAADEYNSGRPYDAATTGGNYGADVAERMVTIQEYFPAPILTATLPTEPKVAPRMNLVMEPWVDSLANEAGPGGWGLAADGSIYALFGAPFLGCANREGYFAGRRAAQLRWRPAGLVLPHAGYTIIDTAGETYNY